MTALINTESGGSRGGLLEPPFEAKLFHFHGDLFEKLGKTEKRTPICKFEPPFKESWIRPWLNPKIKYYEVKYHCINGGKKHISKATGAREGRYVVYQTVTILLVRFRYH